MPWLRIAVVLCALVILAYVGAYFWTRRRIYLTYAVRTARVGVVVLLIFFAVLIAQRL